MKRGKEPNRKHFIYSKVTDCNHVTVASKVLTVLHQSKIMHNIVNYIYMPLQQCFTYKTKCKFSLTK